MKGVNFGMHYLMRALTLDDEIFEFTIGDVPTGIKPGIFVCLRKPGTPLLKQDTIRRGDPDTHLFEGDLLDMDGERWESIAILLNEIEMTYFINIGFPRCKIFFNACLRPCKYLIYSIIQSFTKGQKFVRGDRQGTAFL